MNLKALYRFMLCIGILFLAVASGCGSDDDLRYRNGLVNYKAGQYSDAVNDFTKVLKESPKHTDAYYFRGLSFYKMEKYSDALKDFDKAIQLNSSEADYYYIRGVVRFKINDPDGACSDISKAAQLGLPEAATLLERKCR